MNGVLQPLLVPEYHSSLILFGLSSYFRKDSTCFLKPGITFFFLSRSWKAMRLNFDLDLLLL